MKKGKKLGIIGVTVIMIAQLFGCGKDVQETTVEQAADEYVYVAEFQQLSAEGYKTGSMTFGKDDKVYFTGVDEAGEYQLFSLKIGESTPEKLPVELGKNISVQAIGIDEEGHLILGLIEYNSLDEAAGNLIEKVEIRKISPDDGSVKESLDVTGALGQIQDLYMQNILVDEEGNYYLNNNQNVYVIKPTGEMLCDISAGTYISSIFQDKSGRVIIGVYENTGWKLKEVSIAGKEMKDIESKISFDYGTYQSGTDTDLLYTQDSILYTCNLKDEKPTEILNWVDSDIDSSSLRAFKILEDGRIASLSLDWNSPDETAELAVLTQKNRAEVPEKKVLTYGTLYLTYYTNKDIVAFNKQSDKYRIEIKQYGTDDEDYETKVSRMSADLSGNKGPDMIDMIYGSASLEEYVSMGLLEDITPYLEKEGGINREALLENIIKAYEYEGKLYSIMPSFGINTVIGKVSDVGSEASWTIDDMIKLMDSKPKDAEILSYSTKSSILELMCMMNPDEFVNEETGTCDFTGDSFKKILEFANRFPKEINENPDGQSQIEKIRNGQLILLDSVITSVQLYQMYEYMFGEEVNFVGYPTIKESGSFIVPEGTTVGINANSENKEGVWEFICFILSKERQENLPLAGGGFPITKEALEKQFEKDMEAEYYEDTDGTQKEKPKAVWGTGDFDVEVYAASKEQVECVKKMIETSKSSQGRLGEKMFAIIDEEAQAYFEGQKSVEDVAMLIQNRVQTYINETR